MPLLPSLHDVRAQLDHYLRAHPEEAAGLAPLLVQLADPDASTTLFDRSNMVGHVTSSLLAIDETTEHGLVIDHLHHQVRIPPGGHVEKARTLLASALREGFEETGLREVRPHPLMTPGLPFDVDSHPISARPAGSCRSLRPRRWPRRSGPRSWTWRTPRTPGYAG